MRDLVRVIAHLTGTVMNEYGLTEEARRETCFSATSSKRISYEVTLVLNPGLRSEKQAITRLIHGMTTFVCK
jgi:hypothetical protein